MPIPTILTTRYQPSNRVLGIILFGIALGVRLAFLTWTDLPMSFGKYTAFAERLLQGHSLGNRLVDLSPFYLYFTAGVQLLAGSEVVIMKSLQAVAGALATVVLFQIGNRVENRRTGMVAGLIYALYGNGIVLETALEPTVWVILLNLLAIAIFQKWADTDTSNPFPLFWAGATVGLSIIAKPNFLLFLPIGAIYVITQTALHPWPKRIKNTCYFLGTAGGIVLLITIRNVVLLGDMVLVTADAGKVFYHGNGPGATALNWTGPPNANFEEEGDKEPDYEHVIFRKIAAKAMGRPILPSESSRYWAQKTLNHIQSAPLRYLSLLKDKFLLFFVDYEIHYIATSYAEYIDLKRIPLVRIGYFIGIGIVGALWAFRRFNRWGLVYGTFAIYLISGILFVVQSRYRMPAVPYLCLFAGFTVSRIADLWSKAPVKTIGVLLVAMVVSTGSFVSYRQAILSLDQWQRATKIHYQLNARQAFTERRFEDAIVALDNCLQLAPGFVPAINLKGQCFAFTGNLPAARNAFETVIRSVPMSTKGYVNMANTFLMTGDRHGALHYLKMGNALLPDEPEILSLMERIQNNAPPDR